jgi:ABC-type amino acid transport substrate-binding protein
VNLPPLLRAAALGAAPAAAQSSAAPAVPDTLAKIRAAKQINVAYSGDSRPFSFAGDGNRPAGYSIDLGKRVIAHIGRTVGVADLKVNWMAAPVAERLEMVRTGKADLDCANTTASLSRMRRVDAKVVKLADAGDGLAKLQSGAIDALADDRPTTLATEMYLLNTFPQ